jgi:ataxin-10
MKEWAVFAIRNICEGNEENQAIIAQLRVQTVLPSQELESAGLEASVVNGRLQLKRKGL